MSYLKRMMNNPSCFGARKMYGAEPAAGFSPSRGVFSDSGSYGARMYGAMPGAGFSASRGVVSQSGHYGAPRTFLATATPRPQPGRLARPSAPPAPPRIFDGCVEFRRDGGVNLYNEDGLFDSQSYDRTGNTLTINGTVHHELRFVGDPTNPIYAPICMIEGTFKPIGTNGRSPRIPQPSGPQVIDACIEVIRNGNGAVRVIFGDGNIVEPGRGGYVLTGHTMIIDGVRHFGILPQHTGHSSRMVFVPLCLIEGTFVGPSTRPHPDPEYPPRPQPPTQPDPEYPPRPQPPTGGYPPRPQPPTHPDPEYPPRPQPPTGGYPPRPQPPRPQPPTPGVFVPPPPAVFNPPPRPQPPGPQFPPRPQPPRPQPVPPGVFVPPAVGPTAPVPVPTGPCDPCDVYGGPSFNPVISGTPNGTYCY